MKLSMDQAVSHAAARQHRSGRKTTDNAVHEGVRERLS